MNIIKSIQSTVFVSLLSLTGLNLIAEKVKATALFVGSFDTNSVLSYDAETGDFIRSFINSGSGGLNGPVALTFGPDDNFYVISLLTNSVLRYDGRSGRFIDEFVTSGSGGLDTPQDLTFGPDGNLYVSSTATDSILRFDGVTGNFIDEFVPSGSGGANPPFGLRFGPDDNLYFSSTLTNEVLLFDVGTETTSTFATGTPGDFPGGITFGLDGNLYVANFGADNINRYDGTTGALIDVFVDNSNGLLDGGPVQPIFGPDGNLYISSRDDNRVVRYDGITGDFIDEFVPSGSNGLSTAGWLAFGETPLPVPESSSSLGLLAFMGILGGMKLIELKNKKQ